jgi:alpha-L-fucosidase
MRKKSMEKRIILAGCLITSALVLCGCRETNQESGSASEDTRELTASDSARLDWYYNAHFGMFIHWGAYSVAARGEWVMNRELIPLDEYKEKYASRFLAENYNPREWAEIAKKAGMKYVVLTARHHDGFCLWDTKTDEFDAMNYGPKKDLIRLYVDAIRDAGLKVGLYYSVADWHHPDYPAFVRNWPGGWESEEARLRFIEHYHSQVRELMTNYGKIDILWWDGSVPDGMEGEKINREVYRLQPGILINNRNDEPYDFNTSEQKVVAGVAGRPWEACMTLNGNWGYHATDTYFKSPREVLKILIRCTSKGGNLLLNVGPKSDGTIPAESVEILMEVGDWLRRNHEFLDGPVERNRIGLHWNNSLIPTVLGNNVYLHFHNPPAGNEFCYSEIGNEIRSVRFLETGRPVEFEKVGQRLFLKNLPGFEKNTITTLVVEVEGRPDEAVKWTED